MKYSKYGTLYSVRQVSFPSLSSLPVSKQMKLNT